MIKVSADNLRYKIDFQKDQIKFLVAQISNTKRKTFYWTLKYQTKKNKSRYI